MINRESSSGTVGRRIKIRRTELGLSQAEVAGLDLSDSYISLLESGRRTPSPDVVAMLAGRLRCSAGWLTSGIDDAEQRSIRLQLKEAELCLHTADPQRALDLSSGVLAVDDRPHRRSNER